MKFGEKLKKLRKEKRMTQNQLATSIGVSVRMIIKYENGESYPRNRSTYTKISDALQTNINYLLTEGEESRSEAQKIIEQTAAMFEGGTLNDSDKLAFIHQMQELYLKSTKKDG